VAVPPTKFPPHNTPLKILNKENFFVNSPSQLLHRTRKAKKSFREEFAMSYAHSGNNLHFKNNVKNNFILSRLQQFDRMTTEEKSRFCRGITLDFKDAVERWKNDKNSRSDIPV